MNLLRPCLKLATLGAGLAYIIDIYAKQHNYLFCSYLHPFNFNSNSKTVRFRIGNVQNRTKKADCAW